MAMQPAEWQLAHELVTLVEQRTAAQAPILQERIDRALAYMDGVRSPNVHTLEHIRRYLTGDRLTPPEPVSQEPPAVPEKVQLLFQRRWVCGVQASGYHNGATCNSQDPHDGWGCGYRWTVPPINDEMAKKLGLDGSTPQPVKQEPTGPRLYVERFTGKQGHVVEMGESEEVPGETRALVHWYHPGDQRSWILLRNVKIIPESRVERCPNGQTRDECDWGENQCELCLQAEDAEAEEIERSMGL